MDWLEKSRNLLREACTPWGIKASQTTKENYGGIFTRDAMMSGIAGLVLKDDVIIKGFENTLNHLKKLQGPQGQITSNFRVENGQITKISFGTLSPKIDSCTWYLVGVGLMLKEEHVKKEDFRESVEKTINLLEGIEYNGKNLMYIPKGGNWADEYVFEGYILYDQVLRAWALGLLGNIYGNTEWYEKSKAIINTIKEAYKNEQSKHYHASFFPGGVFSRFDLAAHTIAAIVLNQDDDFFNKTLDWISDTFLNKEKLPPAFHPVIDEGDPEWDALSKYFLYRFKNMPHHFHNGGIWWIWLGWLAMSLSLWGKKEALEKLTNAAFKYLNNNKEQFDFDEYIAADNLQLNGTKRLVYTASGIAFLSLAKNGFDFSGLKTSTVSSINEPLEIKNEYFDLTNELIGQLKSASLLDKEKLVIGIAGESGSGKSVTAKCLQIELEKLNIPSVILHQDCYYKFPPKENHNKRKADINWVGVNEIKLDLFQSHIEQFKSKNKKLTVPVVDYKKNIFSQQEIFIKDKPVLIIEGVYVFFLDNLDFKVFMERTYHETLEKRKARVREVYDPFVEQVLDIEHSLVHSQKKLADVSVSKDYKCGNEKG